MHLYSTFSVDPTNFLLEANVYQKLQFFAIFGTVGPYFLKQNGEIWHEDADLGLLPQAKFCKKKSLGPIYTKNYKF